MTKSSTVPSAKTVASPWVSRSISPPSEAAISQSSLSPLEELATDDDEPPEVELERTLQRFNVVGRSRGMNQFLCVFEEKSAENLRKCSSFVQKFSLVCRHICQKVVELC